MSAIIRFFWQVCLLRASPASLPGTVPVLTALVVIHLCITIPMIMLIRPSQTFVNVTGIVVTGLAIQALLVFGLLAFKRHRARFMATFGTLVGASTAVLLLVMPMNLAIIAIGQDTLRVITDLASWVELLWWLVVWGTVLHKAAGINLSLAISLAFMIRLLSAMVGVSLFPTP